MILLDADLIENLLKKKEFRSPFSLNVFDSIDSTNTFLKTPLQQNKVAICLAETQTKGRGRLSRTWHSPYGENIYCSSRWTMDVPLSGLSLVVGLSIIRTLKELRLDKDIKIKWPNDLVWQDKKLAGILIEIISISPASKDVVIGMGINVNSNTVSQPLPDKAWCSLFEITDKKYDRNSIIASLLAHLEKYIENFIHYGFSHFIDEWNNYDYLLNRDVEREYLGTVICGKGRGVNSQGELIVEDLTGNKYVFS